MTLVVTNTGNQPDFSFFIVQYLIKQLISLKIKTMNFQECPHYDEIVTVLAEDRDFEDISFEIANIKNCKECSKTEGVCSLWISLAFVEDLKPKMSISDAKVTIDTLNEQVQKIALQLARNLKS